VREPGPDLLGDGEELELLAKHAMVALLRLLLAGDDRVQLRLVFRDDAVDALEHLVLLVAAVVAAGDAGELDDADLAGTLDVRPAAHLDVVADRVGRDRAAGGDDVGEALELVMLAGEEPLRLVGGDLLLHERLVEGDEARDLGLDLREVLRRDAVGEVEVVVEAVVRRRADVHLHVVEDVHDRARHKVRRGVPPLLIADLCHCEFLLEARIIPY